jgi:hypothetical protein
VLNFDQAQDKSLQPVFSTAGLKYYMSVYHKDVAHLNSLVQDTEHAERRLEDLIVENSFGMRDWDRLGSIGIVWDRLGSIGIESVWKWRRECVLFFFILIPDSLFSFCCCVVSFLKL